MEKQLLQHYLILLQRLYSLFWAQKVLLEGPQSYFLSNAAEKFWDSGTSANTDASGMLCAARLNLCTETLRPLIINIHKSPGSSQGRRMNM